MDQKSNKLISHYFLLQYHQEKVQLKKNPYDYPEISFEICYPQNKKDDMKERVLPFTFPMVKFLLLQNQATKQTYNFIITDIDGSRLFAHCCFIISESTLVKPINIIFISFKPLCLFFSQLISSLFATKNIDKQSLNLFLDSLNRKPIPKKGELFKIPIPQQIGYSSHFEFTRKNILLGDFDTQHLLTIYNSKQIVCLFASLIFERRIVVLSNNLTTITNAVQTLVRLLSPFKWEHALIPLLPETMIDACSAPLPFVIGLYKSLFDEVEDMIEDETVFVDLDARKLEIDPIDMALLPSKYTACLMDDIQQILDNYQNTNEFDQNLFLEQFYKFFIKLFYDYKEHFVLNKTSNEYEFDFDSFTNKKNRGMKKFLLTFSQTQMFERFFGETEYNMKENPNRVTKFDKKILEFKKFDSQKGSSFKKFFQKRKKKETEGNSKINEEVENTNQNSNGKETNEQNQRQKQKEKEKKAKSKKDKKNKLKHFFKKIKDKDAFKKELEKVENEEDEQEDEEDEERILSVIRDMWHQRENNSSNSHTNKNSKRSKSKAQNENLILIRNKTRLNLVEKFERLAQQQQQEVGRSLTNTQTITRENNNSLRNDVEIFPINVIEKKQKKPNKRFNLNFSGKKKQKKDLQVKIETESNPQKKISQQNSKEEETRPRGGIKGRNRNNKRSKSITRIKFRINRKKKKNSLETDKLFDEYDLSVNNNNSTTYNSQRKSNSSSSGNNNNTTQESQNGNNLSKDRESRRSDHLRTVPINSTLSLQNKTSKRGILNFRISPRKKKKAKKKEKDKGGKEKKQKQKEKREKKKREKERKERERKERKEKEKKENEQKEKQKKLYGKNNNQDKKKKRWTMNFSKKISNNLTHEFIGKNENENSQLDSNINNDPNKSKDQIYNTFVQNFILNQNNNSNTTPRGNTTDTGGNLGINNNDKIDSNKNGFQNANTNETQNVKQDNNLNNSQNGSYQTPTRTFNIQNQIVNGNQNMNSNSIMKKTLTATTDHSNTNNNIQSFGNDKLFNQNLENQTTTETRSTNQNKQLARNGMWGNNSNTQLTSIRTRLQNKNLNSNQNNFQGGQN
ncbi:receptor mediated endocytosis [Anaeramoeba flamelloides]|uniref:Receptor mediated endocytosis n=1 Tax=Anaeramoeba flamelloides TaxID=1746091 RepID=A0AAV7YTG3_9EUKA|nr:receptor mediated endocytosis [Anaeramoeba flamelloides]